MLGLNANGIWLDSPASGVAGQRINENFSELALRSPKVNYSATNAPTVNDDSPTYAKGSKWWYGSRLFINIDPTDGAAVWIEIISPAPITAHIADLSTNPHHVTAAQVGAYTTGAVDIMINNLSVALQFIEGEDGILHGSGLAFNTDTAAITFIDDDEAIQWTVKCSGSHLVFDRFGDESIYFESGGIVHASGFVGDGSGITGLGSAAYLAVGTSSGNIPVLTTGGKLANSTIPDLALTQPNVVSTQSAMLALSGAQVGDFAIRTDVDKTFVLSTNSPGTLGDWIELRHTNTVTSVNGHTGVVTLVASDIPTLAPINNATFTGTHIAPKFTFSANEFEILQTGGTFRLHDITNNTQPLIIEVGAPNDSFSIAESGDSYFGYLVTIHGTLFCDSQICQGTGTLTDGATINWNLDNDPVATVTLGGNRAFAFPSNIRTGARYTLIIKQDPTGSRIPTWHPVFKWVAGTPPVLSTAANSIDIIQFFTDGTMLFGVLHKGFN